VSRKVEYRLDAESDTRADHGLFFRPLRGVLFEAPEAPMSADVGALLTPKRSSDVPLRCRCGHVRGVAIGVSPSSGFRFVCYCKDCQAFACFLGRADVLDGAGGTDIFQMAPGSVKLTSGTDAMRCLRFSPKSRVLRWYADCCRTPIGNTAASPRFPIVAIIHSLMDHEGRPRDEVLGPTLCRIYERSAVGPLPPNAPPPPSLRVFGRRASKLLGWLVRGLNRPTPFFDDRTKAPRAKPHVLTPSERAAL
jgi:hypothetical protein